MGDKEETGSCVSSMNHAGVLGRMRMKRGEKGKRSLLMAAMSQPLPNRAVCFLERFRRSIRLTGRVCIHDHEWCTVSAISMLGGLASQDLNQTAAQGLMPMGEALRHDAFRISQMARKGEMCL